MIKVNKTIRLEVENKKIRRVAQFYTERVRNDIDKINYK